MVIALVAWALRLMERAIESQEFSLMLAGFLVASSAAAMMTVYFLMGNYMVYIHQASTHLPADYALSLEAELIDLPVESSQVSFDFQFGR
ncbi:hypothetical protein [Leptolyngbya sp. PCC 6406]|uniref:hypothetical protein n=1 Tax=Leptolyngbya sp. PCC 6406 TaxID=1173264 RepID=UPI00192B8CDD|nr:hypothetical protein [Leptolyngbya sp. PCC 6406]